MSWIASLSWLLIILFWCLGGNDALACWKPCWALNVLTHSDGPIILPLISPVIRHCYDRHGFLACRFMCSIFHLLWPCFIDTDKNENRIYQPWPSVHTASATPNLHLSNLWFKSYKTGQFSHSLHIPDCYQPHLVLHCPVGVRWYSVC